MTTVTIPVSLGGTGTPYTDGTGLYGMASKRGYGYNTYLMPMLSEVMAACALAVEAAADVAAAGSATALTGAETLILTQSGSPARATMQQVVTLANGSTGVTGATVTTSAPLLNHAQTWNAAGITFTGWKLNITDTASAAGSLLVDLQVGGSSKFSVQKDGSLTLRGNVLAGTDNAVDIGASGANRPRTGYFGTSVVTARLASPAAADMLISPGGIDRWYFAGAAGGHFRPFNNNAFDIGSVAEAVRTGHFGTSVETPAVKFPTTQVASADPNTLDDYEEGTFTPSITFGGGSTGLTYGARNGSYTKVGRAVHFRFYILLSAKGSSTGSVLVTGLPFTSQSDSAHYAPVFMWANSVTGIGGNLQAYNNPGATSLVFSYLSTSTGAATNFTDANCTNVSEFMVSGTYFV